LEKEVGIDPDYKQKEIPGTKETEILNIKKIVVLAGNGPDQRKDQQAEVSYRDGGMSL